MGLAVIIQALLKNKEFWKIVAQITAALFALVRDQKSAKTDAERAQVNAKLELQLEDARLQRMELEIELKKRELELQKLVL